MTKKTSSNIKDIDGARATFFFFLTFLRHESIKRLIKMLVFFLIIHALVFFFKYMEAHSDSVKKVT